MTCAASIQVNLNHVIGTVHPHLYGANLEHIGRSIYGGVWAELLVNRKFAGHDRMYVGESEGLSHQHPSFGVVLPWEAVNPGAGTVRFVHDQTTRYVGAQSQRITVLRADGRPHGIQQGALTLRAGHWYICRLVLKGQSQPVRVMLGTEVWNIPAAPDEWTAIEHQFSGPQDTGDAALSITVTEPGSLWIGCVSLMPDDHVDGFRPDVLAALRQLGPTFLRLPGGNFASAYHWRDGIGDRDRRPPYLDPAWNAWESNDVGTHEYARLCDLIGAELLLTANLGDGTPAEAADWVAYCNAPADTPLGALRAANGHPDPLRVQTWFVGNEQFGNWQVGHCDAETYAVRYRQFADAMLAADPTLRLIAVGVPTDLYGDWNELVLEQAGAMDALSVHYYSIRTERWERPPSPDELYWPRVAAAREVEAMLDRTLEIAAAHSRPPVPLAFDEWNTYVGGKPPDFFEDYSVADALYAAAVMNACLRRADRIVMSGIFNLINVMGNFRVTPTQIWATPTCLVLELMTRLRGPLSVAVQVACPVVDSSGAGNLPPQSAVPLVDAAATFDPPAGMLYLSLVNRSPTESAEIHLTGVDRQTDAALAIVAGAGPLALNTESHPDVVVIEHDSWPPGQSALTLRPHSVTLVTLAL
jgi:alpha-N-arabinofuranosidase